MMEPRISIITLGVQNMAYSIQFYRDGLGFPTEAKDDASIAFFMTSGTRFALYPLEKLAEDISPSISAKRKGFNGITLAHNVRSKELVPEVLSLAESAGGKIVKHAQDTFWGGYSGYFADLDGYYWEVAWGPMFKFDENGNMTINEQE